MVPQCETPVWKKSRCGGVKNPVLQPGNNVNGFSSSPFSSPLLSFPFSSPLLSFVLLSSSLLSFSMMRTLIHLSLTPLLVPQLRFLRRRRKRRRKPTPVLQNPKLSLLLHLFLPLIPDGRYNKSITLLVIYFRQQSKNTVIKDIKKS